MQNTDPIVECARCGELRPLVEAVAEGWNADAEYHAHNDWVTITFICPVCQTTDERAEGIVAATFPDETDTAILGAVEALVHGQRPPR